MRYAWDQFDEYFGPGRVGARMSRWVYRPLLARLARWDAATAPRVHRFVANSRHVAGRIQRYYNRASTVVYPPVDTNFFHPNPAERSAAATAAAAALVVSALVPYKRVDRAIEACALAGSRCALPATDPTASGCSSRRATRVTFLGRVSDEALRDEYRAAQRRDPAGRGGFRHCAARSPGVRRPVVALARGGALETVKNGQTGLLFPEATAASLAETLRVASTGASTPRIRAHAEAFSREEHAAQLRAVIDETMASPIEQRW
jgi:glycosyltransferase involved in cell wall biosynthesis